MVTMSRFRLEKSQDLPGWWVLTDIDNLVVVKFKEHEFNESQKVTFLDDDSKFSIGRTEAQDISRVLREMGEYMFSHWYSIALPTPVFEFRQDDENNHITLIRNKFPKLSIKLTDNCDLKQLSDALKAAGEFVAKYSNIYDRNKR